MKLNRLVSIIRDESKIIATFGNTRLVKKLDGKIEFLGGA